ncbi:hypothetical protein [Herbiconiux daphne]|uniref:Uncharacterized protein n=1 Tax=Herbiconiux daphne TaxID=2970914 RepID=A0ABT2HAR9_9MICO|nr:hypothetical protein [Herbiconiux daphne]MCS5737003.1 hypothetical protein [Herbiconiux daphne]
MNKEKDDLKDMISILIEKGFTDEQIASAIVAYSEEIPAQAPPAGATELDRVVAVVDKINEKADITGKLRVQSVAGIRKGIEMLGGSDDLLLISKAQVDAAIASAINALPKAPTRKDITATYRTRK